MTRRALNSERGSVPSSTSSTTGWTPSRARRRSVIRNDAGAVASGVDRLEYRANGEAWNLYQTPVTLAGLNDGPVAMDYRAVDRAANVEGFHTLSVTLDAAAPLTTLTLGQPQYIDAAGAAYVTQNTVFTFSASDALSGVALTEYKLGAGAWVTAAPFTIANEGTHTILYRSKDNLGNPEADKSFTAIVDNTPPVTTITTGDPKYTAADEKLYVTSATTFTLSASDNLSGVAKTEYRIDNGQWATYAALTVAGEGTHTIDYRSQDNVTNMETFKTLTVIVDNTPPVTTITTGDPIRWPKPPCPIFSKALVCSAWGSQVATWRRRRPSRASGRTIARCR